MIAAILAAAVALFFMTPILFYPTGHSVFSAEHWSALFARAGSWLNVAPGQHSHVQYQGTSMLAGHPVVAAFFVVAYFVSMFLATFSNVAFYHEIMRALNGDAVSIRRGYRFAAARWRAVLLWSLFAGLVGYLIQAVQERCELAEPLLEHENRSRAMTRSQSPRDDLARLGEVEALRGLAHPTQGDVGEVAIVVQGGVRGVVDGDDARHSRKHIGKLRRLA